MCFDAMLMNQTLITNEVSRWPGYVSCDGPSGLETTAGMVCPIRNGVGIPFAVWDLDSTRFLEGADAFFFDRFYASLSSFERPEFLEEDRGRELR